SAASSGGRADLLGMFDDPCRLFVFDQHDMETPRSMRTQLDVLLNICSARGTGDEIDCPRQVCVEPARAQSVPTILVTADQLISREHFDVRILAEDHGPLWS